MGPTGLETRYPVPQLLRLPPEGQAPEHLDLKAHGASVHKTPKTMANEKNLWVPWLSVYLGT